MAGRADAQKNKNNVAPPIETGSKSWFIFRDQVQSFELETPAKLQEEPRILKNNKLPAGWKVNGYAATDIETGIYYMVSITEPLNDLYIYDDSLYMESLRENQQANLEDRTQDTILKRQGLYSYLQMGKARGGNGKILLKSMATVRYNRVITLVAGFEKGRENHPDISRFMRSLRMLEPQQSVFTPQPFAGNSFITDAPAPFVYHLDTSDSNSPLVTYNSRDSMTSEVYTAIVMAAGNKQWYRNAGEYWEEKMAFLTDENDSVVAQFPVSNGEAEGYQVQLQSERLHKYVRMLPFADSLLVLVYVLPRQEAPDERKKRFFDALRFTGTYRKPLLFSSGAASLLTDLHSSDTAVYNDALQRMQDAPFSVADIPELRKALLQHYPLAQYSSTEIQTPTEKINQALLDLADPSIASFAMKNYLPAGERNPLEQSLILDLVARDPRDETYAFIARELNAFPQDAEIAPDVLFTLTQDTDLLSDIFSSLLPLVKRPNLRDGMLSVINSLLTCDSITAAPLQPYEQLLLDDLKEVLKTPEEDSSGFFYNRAYRLISIAGHLKTPGAVALLEQSSQRFGNELKLLAGIQLAAMGKTPEPSFWEKLAADKSVRYAMYHQLQEKNLLKHFPASMATQSKMAESVLWEYALSEATPLGIKEVGVRETQIGEKKALVYFFSISFRLEDGKTGQRLGMAVFPTDKKMMEVLEDWYEIDWETTYTPRQKDEIMDEMIKWLHQ